MMAERPIYSYSFSAENPQLCSLLRSTPEIDAWECVGAMDRRFAQVIVTALNHAQLASNQSTEHCPE
jgi:hypothetical protein